MVIGGRDSIYWDSNMAHNPAIQKIGNEYVLFYIGSVFASHQNNSKSLLHRIGYTTSKKITGPWIRSDQPVINEESNNLVILQDGEKIKLICRNAEPRVFIAEADHYKGPFAVKNDNVCPEAKIEDFCLFKYNNQ